MKIKVNEKDVVIYILILLFISRTILIRDVDNLDEIWNFNFAKCIANGLIPYKDFNIIQGPLLPSVCAVFLRIFGQEMIVMRGLAIILDTTILFFTYKIMDKLKIKDYIKYIILLTLIYIMKDYFTIDYNWSTLAIVLLIIYIDLFKEENIKKNIIIGFLAGILIALKQTTGLVISVATIGYRIIEIRNKQDIKIFFKSTLVKFLTAIFVVFVLIAILYKQGALYYYIDYAIKGVTTFTNKISYVQRLIKNKNIIIKSLSISPIVIYILLAILYYKKGNKECLTLLIYSLVHMILVYPISDESHFVVAILPTVISIAYLINLLADKVKVTYTEEYIINFILKCLCISLVVMFSVRGFEIYGSKNINIELNHFKYLPMSRQMISEIKEVEEYINQNDHTYILDATAALYMIPLDRYNKNFDLFLKGNLGAKGEKGQIDNLENMEEKTILIMKDTLRRNWQNPEEVRNYIKQNMTKIETIGVFDVYRN